MRVRRGRVLVAGVALAFVLAFSFGASGAGAAKAYAASTTLSILSGDVYVRHAGGTFATAADGDQLREGDTIRTVDGRAVLTYFEGSSVTVEPGTEITIDAATASGGATVVLMTQLAGRTWNVVTKLIAGGSRYEIRTPSSTASVRGTEFSVDVDADATTVTTTEGIVMQRVVDALLGTAVDVPVTAGTAQTQRRGEPAAPAHPAPAPKRLVTVSVAATSTTVVDPVGRANGVTDDGRVFAQTPGARVRRVDARIVVSMPDLPDGNVAARAGRDAGAAVTTTLSERGRSESSTMATGGDATAGFEVRRAPDGTAHVLAAPLPPSMPQPHLAPGSGSHRSLSGDSVGRVPTIAGPAAAGPSADRIYAPGRE